MRICPVVIRDAVSSPRGGQVIFEGSAGLDAQRPDSLAFHGGQLIRRIFFTPHPFCLYDRHGCPIVVAAPAHPPPHSPNQKMHMRAAW